MSYIEEILSLNRIYQYSTLIYGDSFSATELDNSDKAIWTKIGGTYATFKRNVEVCCISNKAKSRCLIDLSQLASRLYLESGVGDDKNYSWEQYDIAIFCKGNILNEDNVIGATVITRPVVIKQTTGSLASVLVPGPNTTILNIKVGTVTVGTIFFSPNSSSGVITILKTIELNDGDIINIVSSEVFDPGAEDFAITLSGIAQNVVQWDSKT